MPIASNVDSHKLRFRISHSFYARALVDAVIYLWLHDGHRTNQVMIVPAKQDQGSEDQASHSRQPLVHPNNTAHTLCPLIYIGKRGKVVMLLKLLS
uniref:Uncharacterized protein n=2 Tax=Picea TaxID=3328 RepID=A0A124GMY1_PICGL|nr:hypothetical protein ABT39_MTgene6094 [Picea glauca]QHR89942.1 hypothetical protein Q903MT_gene3964 [Picea sitchensis]